jgi:hypothetical protein
MSARSLPICRYKYPSHKVHVPELPKTQLRTSVLPDPFYDLDIVVQGLL